MSRHYWINGRRESFVHGDGAYDRTFVFEGVLARNPNAKLIVPPRKGAVTGPTVATSPTQRDQRWSRRDRCARSDELAKDDRLIRRSKVEATISREKRDHCGDTRSRAMRARSVSPKPDSRDQIARQDA